MAKITSSVGPTLQAIAGDYSELQVNASSLWGTATRAAGVYSNTFITCTVGGGVPTSKNCFQIQGTVQIKSLYAVIQTGSFTNCTAAFFDLDDGAIQVPLTLNNGDLSGKLQGTFFAKTGPAANTFSINDPATVDLIEGAVVEPFHGFIITQKSGQPTNLRFSYTSTDAPPNVQIAVVVEWKGLSQGATLNPAL